MLPYLLTPLPYISHAACLTSPLPAWGDEAASGGGGKGGGLCEGPSVGFFTCSEEADGNESSRKRLPLCSRGPSSGKPPCLPTVPSSLPPPPPAGRCHSQGTWWAAGQRDLGSKPIPVPYAVNGLRKNLRPPHTSFLGERTQQRWLSGCCEG